ncbi:RecB family exonuclease [soil metagenome]
MKIQSQSAEIRRLGAPPAYSRVVEAALKISPSSAGEFKSCPQLLKFRAIDRLPEPFSPAAARGSLVHGVLERLFREPPEARTPANAERLLVALWDELRAGDLAGLDLDDADWLERSREMLGNLFVLEDPRSVTSSQLEWWVEYELEDLHLRGIIDRLEKRSDGSWVLTDYKTGRVPVERRELQAFFGLRFYALVCWRAFGTMPRAIRLVYLSNPEILTLEPNERMLVAFERQMRALATAIRKAMARDDWRTSQSALCGFCSFRDRCPAWAEEPVGAAARA